MNLQKMNKTGLNAQGARGTKAGVWTIGILLIALLTWSAWSNFGDIRDGWNDGINGKTSRYK